MSFKKDQRVHVYIPNSVNKNAVILDELSVII